MQLLSIQFNEDLLMGKIKDPACTLEEISHLYQEAFRNDIYREIRWNRIDHAVSKRWTYSSMITIKARSLIERYMTSI